MGLFVSIFQCIYFFENKKNIEKKNALIPYVKKIKIKYEDSVEDQMRVLSKLYQDNKYFAVKEMVSKRVFMILNIFFFGYVIFFYEKLSHSPGVSTFLWIENIFNKKEIFWQTIVIIFFLESIPTFTDKIEWKKLFSQIITLGITTFFQAFLIYNFSHAIFLFYLGKNTFLIPVKIISRLKKEEANIHCEEDLIGIELPTESKNRKELINNLLSEIDNLPIFDFVPTLGLQKEEDNKSALGK